jgi:hypothetical protein
MFTSWGCGDCKSLKTWNDIYLILTTKFIHANNSIFVGKWWTRLWRCRFFYPHIFTSTNIFQNSALVVKAIRNAIKNDYVVGAINTGHRVTLIISMKLKEVWYPDSAKQNPTRKFTYVKTVVEWLVSCRFCSQKINLLVFLIGIDDHAGPLICT